MLLLESNVSHLALGLEILVADMSGCLCRRTARGGSAAWQGNARLAPGEVAVAHWPAKVDWGAAHSSRGMMMAAASGEGAGVAERGGDGADCRCVVKCHGSR